MDGRNSSGRKISLLNNDSDVASACHLSKVQLPSLAEHSSSASSCASTPSLTPQTPHLVRSTSSESRCFPTPSPLTPSYNHFDHISAAHAHDARQHYYIVNSQSCAKMDEQNESMYPPIPGASDAMSSAYPMPPQMQQQMPPQPMQQQYRASNSPASEPSHVSTISAASNTKPQPKKNHYPCPMAKQVNCTDSFTTSGHAARHAKKHTGKKDAFCPECNKAFTRKDNMEQHRRTHQNGRGALRSGDDAKVKKPARPQAKKNTIKSEPLLEAAVEQQLSEQQLQVEAQVQAQAQAQAHAAQAAQVQAAQQAAQLPLLDQTLMMQPSGPYYGLGGGIDTVPVSALPMAMPDINGIRPQLHRSNFTNSLEYVPPTASMMADPDALHYTYPSPGLSNGLNSLALAASEHQRRLSEEDSQSRSPQDSPSQDTS